MKIVTGITLVGVSLGSLGVAYAIGANATGHASASAAERMVAAASVYLDTLPASERSRGVWAFDDERRHDWHFIPREREGIALKGMTAPQRIAAHGLLQSVLSSKGYLKATGVMQLEGILGVIEGRPQQRDPEDYYVSLFGTPSEAGPWAWRFEGHHISLNFTAAGGQTSVTPAFMGSNPHVVEEGPHAGWKLLGSEEALARALLASLDDEQLGRAVIATDAPRNIITGNARRVEIDSFEGLPAAEMDDGQRHALMRLTGEYFHNAADEIAASELTRLRSAGVERVHFAWAGGTEPGQGHYYRVHGPTLLIEYDNVQGGANHVHSVWRDPENDFGDDLLRRHYEEAEHHGGDGAHH